MTRIFQHFNEGIVIIDPTGEILICNAAARKILKMEERVHTINDLPKEIQHMWEYRYKRLPNTSHIFDVDVDVIPGFGDGMAIILRIPNQTDHSGLNENRDEFQALINMSIDDIIIADGQGKILRVNDRCEQYYNCSKDKLIGRNVSDLEQEGVFFLQALLWLSTKRKIFL